jgi:DNA-directed RNA polymerase subunit RPC12/RpoP
MNDIERYNFWNSEINTGIMCTHCGSRNTEQKHELEYSDDSDEPNMSNHLVSVYYYICKDCGDITDTADYSTK